MQHLQISNGYFQLWHSYIQAQGQDWQHWNLSTEQRQQLHVLLQKPVDHQSDFGFFMTLMALTQKHMNQPTWLLEMAKSVTPAHFGLLGYMASHSESVAQGIEYVVRFSRLVLDGEQMVPIKIQQLGQKIRLYWPLLAPELAMLNELTIAAMVYLTRQFLPNQEMNFEQIDLVHAPQMAIKHYQQFYQCPIRFSQNEYAMILSNDSLSIRPYEADPTLIQFLVKQAEEALAQRDLNQNIVAKMQWIVTEYLRQRQQAPKIETIAAEMLLSVRTLQRQLKLQNSSFKKILEQARMQRCQDLLAHNASLSEIAQQLGYSDQSALARAYKQHSGQTLLKTKHDLQSKASL